MSKKTLVFIILGAIILFGSLSFNAYVFFQANINNARIEGANFATQNIIMTAEKDGKVIFNGQDKDGKPMTISLVLEKQEEQKK